MVNALRKEPGSYTRAPGDGAEVVCDIRPSDGGFIAGWEYISEPGPAGSHEEEFSTHADALKYLGELRRVARRGVLETGRRNSHWS